MGAIDSPEGRNGKNLQMDRERDAGARWEMRADSEQRKQDADFRQILGLRFFVGGVQRAINLVRNGGLLVVPAAPALKNLANDVAYRQALIEADVAIADSSLMVMVWNFLQRDTIHRLSGLEYLAELLKQSDVREPGRCFW